VATAGCVSADAAEKTCLQNALQPKKKGTTINHHADQSKREQCNYSTYKAYMSY